MKNKEKIYTKKIPSVSNEFAKTLSSLYPKLDIKPGLTQDDILYNAGQRSVVDYIITIASSTEIISDINKIKKEDVNISLLDKLLGKFKYDSK